MFHLELGARSKDRWYHGIGPIPKIVASAAPIHRKKSLHRASKRRREDPAVVDLEAAAEWDGSRLSRRLRRFTVVELLGAPKYVNLLSPDSQRL